ncbi:transglycosylase SLT domain-containing protein, partial [Niallia sp. FSL W8-1348]|uniref:transglycosylase SLT domain-containing protein n=1 Tax=Niallia sp. FSL W8-1348 TaxID=2954656 RepID=UPI0030F8860A
MTKWEDQGADVVLSMKTVNKELKNVDGTMDDMAKNVEKSFGNRSKKVWRDTKNALKPLGEVLLSFAEDTLPKVSKEIERVTDFINDLSPEAKKSIVIFSGIVAAVGPVALGLGTVSAGIGTVMKFLSPLLPALGAGTGLTGVLAALTGPIGLTALALGGLGIGFIALDKQMDKPIIKSNIFAGEISAATEKAVGSYMNLDEKATAELNSLAWSNQTITDEMAKNMVSKYQEMGDQVLQAMKENHNEQLAEQQRLFAESDILTEQEEAKRLAKLKAKQLEEEKTYTEQQARIKEIWTLAAEQKRGITDAEANEIAKLQEQMRTKAVEELSASQEEQMIILNNLKEQKSVLEAESAADTVKKSVETRDKVISDADKQYAETVSYAETARDELGIISSDEAKKIIGEAERKRNETVTKAQDMHYDVVSEAKAQANEHVSEVDWETGEVLGAYDRVYNGVLNAVNWIRGLFDKEPLAKKGTVKETGRQKLRRQDAKLVAGYANGTSSNGHPGGPAIVGEEGRELGFVPGKGITLLGARGPEFHSNLPRGTSVLPNKQTEQMLRSYGFPGYAEGIGDYFNMFMDGAGSVWDFMTGKFNLKDEIIPDWLNKHTGSPLKLIGEYATSWIKDIWSNWFGSIGSSSSSGSTAGVKQWAGIATQALMLTNQFSESNLDRLLYQMQTESGGNPKAINLWDINAKRGIPSKGLMQVIDPTFKAHAMPGYNKDIYDPLSNIIASIRYAVSRYGSLEKAYRGVGYATGGLINNEGLYRLAEGGWSEYVIPTDPSKRTEAMKLLALAGKQIQGNKRPNQLPNVNNGNDNSVM